MRLHDTAFYFAAFALVGIFLASSGFSFGFIFFLTAFACALFLFAAFLWERPKLFWVAGFSFFALLGALYANGFIEWQNNRTKIEFDKPIKFLGIVSRDPERGKSQDIVADLQRPYSGKILVKAKPHPEFFYGDLISIEGTIKKPEPEGYAKYLAKENISGVTTFSKIKFLAGDRGSPFRSFLFKLKNKTISIYEKILPAEEAAFLSGITLGERAEFSPELKNAMAGSGTTHLVALSGYNISIIGWAVRQALGRFLGRRPSFLLTIFIIAGFVFMTGAQASVVRAAFMGIILLSAGEIGRPHSFRNAITLTAFFMALENPLLLRFDVGFELSFLALLGLAYISPIVKKVLHLGEKQGFLAWRENLAATIGAQLAVLPILIFYFNNLSIVSLVANVLVLEIMPVSMGIGFIAGGIGFISSFLAVIFGWLLHPVLLYELWVIKFFGKFPTLSFSFSASLFLGFLYYVLLSVLIFWNQLKERKTLAAISFGRS